MSWPDKPDLSPGTDPDGSQMEILLDQVESLTAPGWTSYTPSWTTGGTAPAIGNGTLAGRYRKSSESDLVMVEFIFQAGSTTTFGTGTWFFSTPVTPSATAVARCVGPCYVLDTGTADRCAIVKFEDTTKFSMVSAATGVFTNTNPQTWANGDKCLFTIWYEPA